MSQDRVSVTITEQGIAYVRLDRPEKRNALDRAMLSDLVATARKLKKNKQLRAVILSGEGASFCAGLDFPYVAKHPDIIPRFFLKLPWSQDNMFQRVGHIWRSLPVPVIAAVHGHCFGGGLQIALGCDVRFTTADAQWSIMEIKWGLIPDMSGTVALSRLMRYDIAQELTMTGRIISGADAVAYGLATHCVDDPIAAATQLAEEISERSPNAVAVTKGLFAKIWKAGDRRALFWERMYQLRLLGRKNQRIAMSNGIKGENRPFESR
ncbi:crotonase/enoyl-CoA hydratase family protein [Reinekea blandensis]|uniref:Enoyl-CoA hydratase n=1 Tax=Reinekea blandensis MED297 TaxID=314283 RepID=A4BEF6_9GAMM|nr:crotonase/enoyl-CoA hydratase family protein [Reinekea blandensis]EAR09383.1 enoyl-CoA hydratase [Reinekea sp. MED297] [Reinekea blandensis MED297]